MIKKKLTVFFSYVLLVHTKKSAFKSKDFFTFCAYPCLGKKDISSTLSELCYCWRKFFICLMQYHPEILKIFLDNKGQMVKCGRYSGWPAATPNQFLKYNKNCKLLYTVFKLLDFFESKYFWPYLLCFSFVLQILFV